MPTIAGHVPTLCPGPQAARSPKSPRWPMSPSTSTKPVVEYVVGRRGHARVTCNVCDGAWNWRRGYININININILCPAHAQSSRLPVASPRPTHPTTPLGRAFEGATRAPRQASPSQHAHSLHTPQRALDPAGTPQEGARRCATSQPARGLHAPHPRGPSYRWASNVGLLYVSCQ